MKRICNLAKSSIIILTILNLATVAFCGCGCGLGGRENKNMDLDYKDYDYQVEDLSLSVDEIVIQVVYDNNKYLKGLKEAWGFSCFITTAQKNILFDTGGDGDILLGNMEKMDIDPMDVEIVVLSHIHGDHVGGLGALLDINPDLTVFVPQSFPKDFKRDIKDSKAALIEIDKPKSICKGCFSTGQLGSWIKEQSLIINTDKGIIVVTGCAHPGIVDIVKHSKELLKKEVLFVMGGFHLGGQSEDEIGNIISSFKAMDVQYCGPCHCSGDTARRLFAREYGKNYIDIGVGKQIVTEDLF